MTLLQTHLNSLKNRLNTALFGLPTPPAAAPLDDGGQPAAVGFGDLVGALNRLGHAYIPATPAPKDGYVVVNDGEEKRADKLTDYERQREALLQPLARRAIEAYLNLSQLAADWNAVFDQIESINKVRDSKRIRDGKKANLSLFLLDRSVRLQRTQADVVRYEEDKLLKAKELVDACVEEWSKDANRNLVKLVSLAFKKGRRGYSRAAMLNLRNMESDDPRWSEAMAIIKDAELLDGAASYLLAAIRDDKGSYVPLPLDIAAVRPWPLPEAASPVPIKPIRSAADYDAAMAEIHALIAEDPDPESPEGERLDVLSSLAELWERSHANA